MKVIKTNNESEQRYDIFIDENGECGGSVLMPESEENYTMLSADNDNHLVLPPRILKKFGIEPGVKLRFIEYENRIEIYPNIHSLSKVYIEPTSKCNLKCQTCVRNTWNEPMGDMDIKLFDTIIGQLKEFGALRTVMLGGFGEPTFHKDILYMIGRLKSLGQNVEMTSNGTLLNEALMRGLIKNKLDTLWVSFDGTSAESFEDIREGAHFEALVQSLIRLNVLNLESEHKVKIGIAFVVMKKNVHELKYLGELANRVGATKISVSNVIPYSEDMMKQMLCDEVLDRYNYRSYETSLPLINLNPDTLEPLSELLMNNNNINFMGYKMPILQDSCKFIQERSTFIRWDGMVSPCMGLLHSYQTFFPSDGLERCVKNYSIGDINEKRLKEIWDSQEYTSFREKVDKFDFSPCFLCGHCNMSASNEEDCFGNYLPACGGCLWSQGVIQCP